MLPPGRTVGGYRIVKYMARGGFSEVYRAQSIGDGALVALKVISLTMPEELISAERLGASLQQRFQQKHGMVPRTFEVGQTEDYFFIAMECVDGPSLEAEVAHGPMDPVRAAQHAILICRFLERAHRFATTIEGTGYETIIHADLKPSHIFIKANHHLTVLDFGIAKALEKSRQAKTIRFVTQLYASPQRLHSGRGSEQDDLWATVVMLYEMVRGKRPHAGIEDPPTYVRLARAIETCAEREPLPTSCPRELSAIIDKGLRFAEELRYGSAGALRADLEAFLRHESPSAMKQFSTPPTVKAEPRPRGTSGSPPGPPPAVPTLPRPAGLALEVAGGSGGVLVAAPPAPSSRVRVASLIGARRAAWVAMLAALTMLFTSEGVAWLAAERFRAGLPALDVAGIRAAHERYQRQRRWSMFHIGQGLRLNRPLKSRLTSLADSVFADFRQEDSTVKEGHWRQATEALDWVSQLAPEDRSLAPKKLIAKGHLDRIAAYTRERTKPDEAEQLYRRAIEAFEQAAHLDPRAPDPYLGLSRIYIYSRKGVDVDRGAAAIREAESRGYTQGWRDRAQLGDGYRIRADRARRSGALDTAREDYARCVEILTPIVDKGRWKYNHDYCQRHFDALDRGLDEQLAEWRW